MTSQKTSQAVSTETVEIFRVNLNGSNTSVEEINGSLLSSTCNTRRKCRFQNSSKWQTTSANKLEIVLASGACFQRYWQVACATDKSDLAEFCLPSSQYYRYSKLF